MQLNFSPHKGRIIRLHYNFITIILLRLTMNSFDNEKPIVHINGLFSAMASSSKELTVAKNKIVYINRNNSELCYLLLDGVVVMKSLKDHKVIGRATAPFFFGFNIGTDGYLQTMSEVTFNVIESKLASDIIKKENLWEHLYFVFRRIAIYLYKKERSLNEPSAHDQIHALLKILSEENDEIRYVTPVIQYVQENSSLSRSTIFKVLAELKTSKTIDVQRGILIKVNKR